MERRCDRMRSNYQNAVGSGRGNWHRVVRLSSRGAGTEVQLRGEVGRGKNTRGSFLGHNAPNSQELYSVLLLTRIAYR